jgi:prophage regulatory protein
LGRLHFPAKEVPVSVVTPEKPTRKARTSKDTPAPDPVPTSRFLSLSRLPQVKTRVGLSRSAIYALMAQGKFPIPVSLGRSIAWVDCEIDAFIAERMQARKAS